MIRPLAWCLVLAASAQAQPTRWSTLEPAFGVSVPVRGGMGPEWSAGTGVAARLSSPAYGGWVRASVGASAYAVADGAPAGVPAFRMVTATAGWGPGVTIGRARVWAGPQVGGVYLQFDTVDTDAFQRVSETEAAVGAWARLDAPVAGRVRAWVEAEALRVAFASPATVATASAGLAVRLDTPGWLRRALQ